MSELKPKSASQDRVFILVLAVIGGNIAGWTIRILQLISANPTSPALYSYLVADIVALVGVLWLVRHYRLNRRLAKQQDKDNKVDRHYKGD